MRSVADKGELRPALLVFLNNRMIARDLLDSDCLSALGKSYALHFACNDPELAKLFAHHGSVRVRNAGLVPRYWLWNCAVTVQSLQKFRSIVGKMDREFFNRKSAERDYWHWSTRLSTAIAKSGLGRPFVAFARWMLSCTVNVAIRSNGDVPYVGVFVPTGLRDFAGEDVVRWARRRNIPTIGLQANWDCFNLKQMLTPPDQFLVWGEQSWYFARLLQDMPHATLHVVGSQRHDTYFRGLPTKKAAREKLGLDQNVPIVLFCGVAGPFDELALLSDLEAAIEAGRLPRELQILYKPHPKSTPEKRTDQFAQQGFRRSRLIGFGGKGVWNPLHDYPMLLRAVDAVLSPYSTMGLEAALCGRPTLCLGFHTDLRLPYWRFALEFLHIQPYRFAPWAIRCDRREELIAGVERLLALAADPTVERTAIETTVHIIYRDATPFPERVLKVLDTLLARRGSAK